MTQVMGIKHPHGRSRQALPHWLLKCLLGVVFLWVVAVSPAQADNIPQAEHLFQQHCVGCHVGGGNIVRRGKTLKLRVLTRNGVDTPEAIATLTAQGRGAMPSYRDRLTPEEINLLAEYVWQKAQTNWK